MQILFSSSKSQDQVKRRFFLNVVIGQGSSIFELLSGKDQSLLVWRDTLLILDFGLDVFDCVTSFYFQGDGFACQGFYEDLHTSTESKNQVERRFFLNVVIGQRPSIFELLSGKDQSLLVWRDTLLILDFGL